jgi:hypothetical protein
MPYFRSDINYLEAVAEPDGQPAVPRITMDFLTGPGKILVAPSPGTSWMIAAEPRTVFQIVIDPSVKRVQATPEAMPHEWAKWFDLLNSLSQLREGWNGYAAPAPGPEALRTAKAFLTVTYKQAYPPTRVAASVMGGVGITRREGGKKVYVEFYNDGTAHALFSSGRLGMRTRRVRCEETDSLDLVAEMRNYLNG